MWLNTGVTVAEADATLAFRHLLCLTGMKTSDSTSLSAGIIGAAIISKVGVKANVLLGGPESLASVKKHYGRGFDRCCISEQESSAFKQKDEDT